MDAEKRWIVVSQFLFHVANKIRSGNNNKCYRETSKAYIISTTTHKIEE